MTLRRSSRTAKAQQQSLVGADTLTSPSCPTLATQCARVPRASLKGMEPLRLTPCARLAGQGPTKRLMAQVRAFVCLAPRLKAGMKQSALHRRLPLPLCLQILGHCALEGGRHCAVPAMGFRPELQRHDAGITLCLGYVFTEGW